MEQRWQIEDIIDLEFFLHADDSDPEARNAATDRNRAVYINELKSLEDKARLPGRQLLFHWLKARRQALEKENKGAGELLPGRLFRSAYRLLCIIGILAGMLAGANICALLLRYDGVQPVNVSLYITVLVISQMLLLLLLLAGISLRRLIPALRRPSTLYSLLAGLLATGLLRLQGKGKAKMSAASRNGIQAVLGLIKGRRQVYGNIMFLPIFTILQGFGISFNIGILAATFLRVLSTDLAFGWQSTLQLGNDALYQLVSIMALPWSWLLGQGQGLPTAKQIAGSHIILKDGLYSLTTADLVAWWPFMLLSVLVYGLTPRLLLLFAGMKFQKTLLERIPFNHADCEALLQTLRAPRLQTIISPSPGKSPQAQQEKTPEAKDKAELTGRKESKSTKKIDSPKAAILESAPAQEIEPADVATPETTLALIPDEIAEDCSLDELRQIVLNRLGLELGEIIPIDFDDELPVEQIAAKAAVSSGLLLLLEGWQPPIRETMTMLTDLRQEIEAIPVSLALIGKPKPETIFTPLNPVSSQVWRERVSALADPYLRMETLCEEAA